MNKLKQARLSTGLTQQKMSEKLNIPCRTIQDWEADKHLPPEWVETLVIKELNTITDNNKLNLEDKGYKQNL